MCLSLQLQMSDCTWKCYVSFIDSNFLPFSKDQEQFEESKIADRQTPRLASRQGRGTTHNEPPRPPSTDIISSLMRKVSALTPM